MIYPGAARYLYRGAAKKKGWTQKFWAQPKKVWVESEAAEHAAQDGLERAAQKSLQDATDHVLDTARGIGALRALGTIDAATIQNTADQRIQHL